ncbi:MAG: STAS domain-containing protein [Pseudomonadota bacterium]
MHVFPLPRSLTIGTIQEVHQSITEWIGEGDHHALDGQAVESLDATGIQLLVSLIGTGTEPSTSLMLIHPSTALKTSLPLAGLADLLQESPIETDEQADPRS